MKYVGAHVSAAGGVENAPLNAQKIGAAAFALFTKNQKRWEAKPLSEKSILDFHKNLDKTGILADNVLPHDSYLINLGNPDNEKRKKSYKAFVDELKRVEQLGLSLLNFHPGGHLNQVSESECITLIAEAINNALSETDLAIAVIENTAGQGSWIGYRFEHLRDIIDKVNDKNRIAVCLDTCHTFAGAYDLSTFDKSAEVFSEFERIVGFSKLKGMHINDAKSEYASRVDRHASIGKGNIGLECFKFIMQDKRFDNMPLILETPAPEMWEEEIRLLNSFIR
jgi:deoxyribonuclease IV